MLTVIGVMTLDVGHNSSNETPVNELMYGIRWNDGYWQVHLIWMHWKTKRWCSSACMVGKKYKKLGNALLALRSADCVMIFPV